MNTKTAEYAVRVEYVNSYKDDNLVVDDIVDVESFDSLQDAIACADGINADEFLNDEYDQIDITIIEYDEDGNLIPTNVNDYLRRIKEIKNH